MLASRLLVSAVLIPLLALVLYFDHRAGSTAPFLLALCLLLAARAVWEFVTLLRLRGLRPSLGWTTACSLAVVVAAWRFPLFERFGELVADTGPLLCTWTFAVLALFAKAVWRYRRPGSNMTTLSSELLIVAYVGVLLGVTAQLRWVAGPEAGYLAFGSLVIAVKSGDVGAYTLGRLFGRRKMAPRLSPGKTWTGAFGALVAASLTSVLWLQFATPLFNTEWQSCAWYWAAVYGLVLGLTGLIGDLCESLVKRDVGAKDSASLLPGFGGVLDLLDSFLFAGPVAYLLWNILPLATWR